MSPLDVVDHRTCLDGGPVIPRHSQQQSDNRHSWTHRGEKTMMAVKRKDALQSSTLACFQKHEYYPVIHVPFSLCCQDQRPPLFGPFSCVHGKGIVAVPEHRNQHRHFIYKHMKVLQEPRNRRELTSTSKRRIKYVILFYLGPN